MTTIVKPVSATATLPMDAELLGALTLVGRVVHVDQVNYRVHSIEGDTWYAFDQDGQVTVDTHLTERFCTGDPIVTLLPIGAKIGEGFSHMVPLSWITAGWSLVKANEGSW